MKKNRFLSLLLTFVMILSMMPVSVFAETQDILPASENDPADIVEQVVTDGEPEAGADENTVPQEPEIIPENELQEEAPQEQTSLMNDPEPTNVAQIGEVEYETLQAAFDAATAGQTIKLLMDIDSGNTKITINKSCTLDMNSHTISGNISGNYGVLMVNKSNGTISIIDSSTDKGGTISNSGSGQALYVQKCTNFSAENITINTSSSGTGIKTAATNAEFTNCIINSDISSALIANGTQVTLNNCTVTGNVTASTSGVISVNTATELTINGGSFENKKGNEYKVVNAYHNNASVKITAGNFSGKVEAVNDTNGIPIGSIAISGGYFTSDVSGYLADDDATMKYYKCIESSEVEGYSFKVIQDTTTYVAKIGNEKYETVTDAFGAVRDGGTVTLLSDVSFDKPLDYAVVGERSFTFDLNGKTITSTAERFGVLIGDHPTLNEVHNCITIKNGTIDGSGITHVENEKAAAITVFYAAKCNLIDLTVIGPENQYAVCSESTDIYIGGNSMINGKLYASPEYAATDTTPYFDAGTISISRGYFTADVSSYAVEGCEQIKTPSSDANRIAYPYMIGKFVAQIGTEKYETLQEAFNASSDGQTIQLIGNSMPTQAVFDKYGNTVTLDLNGYTVSGVAYNAGDGSYTVGNPIRITAGTLVIDDTVGGGKIVAKEDTTYGSNYCLYLFGGNAELKNGTLESRKCAVIELGNSLFTVDGGKIIANGTDTANVQAVNNISASLVIKGGELESNGKALFAQNDKAEVNGGYFKGTVDCKTYKPLKGGYYTMDVSDFVADGYTVAATDTDDTAAGVDISVYKYKVVEAPKTYVAQIGDVKYETLAEAFDEAVAGDTIEVLTETEELVDLTAFSKSKELMYFFNPEISLDNTITGNAKNAKVVFVKDNKNVTYGEYELAENTIVNDISTDNYSYECELRTYDSDLGNSYKIKNTKSVFYGDMETMAGIYEDESAKSTSPLRSIIEKLAPEQNKNRCVSYNALLPTVYGLDNGIFTVDDDFNLTHYGNQTAGHIDFRLIGDDFIFDLKGHKIYQVSSEQNGNPVCTSDGSAAVRLSEYNKVTIKDSVGGGLISGSLAAVDYYGDYSHSNEDNQNNKIGGILILDSGTLIGRMVPCLTDGENYFQNGAEKGCVVMMNDYYGTFIMNGGVLAIERGEYKWSNGTVSVTKLWPTAAAIQVTQDAETATITLNGGTIYTMPEDEQAPTNLEEDYPTIIYRDVNATVTKSVSENVTLQPTYVAQIGTVRYDSLASAITAVPTDGTKTTITMIADETFADNATMTIAAGNNIVLDLNGKTVTGKNLNIGTWAFLTNNGALEITDTSTDKKGKITASTSPETNGFAGHYTVLNKNTMVLTNGTIEETSEKVGGGSNLKWALRNEASAGQIVSLTINGGAVVGEYNAVSNYVYDNTSTCNFTVTGGSIVTNGRFSPVTVQIASGTAPHANVNITGGEFIVNNIRNTNANGNAIIYCDDQSKTVNDCSGLRFSATGGKFNTYNTGMLVQFDDFKTDTVVPAGYVSGGVFKVKIDDKEIVAGKTCVDNTDAATKDAYPWAIGTVTVSQPQTNTSEIETGTSNILIGKNENSDQLFTEDEAVNWIEESINNNNAVNQFTGSKIEEAVVIENDDLNTIKNVLITDSKIASDEVAKAAITSLNSASEFTDYVTVSAENASVFEMNFKTENGSSKSTTIRSMAFDVKPMLKVTVTPAEGDPVTVTTVIPNECIKEPITFRLPVESSVPVGTIVKVYHSESIIPFDAEGLYNEDDYFFGNYKVQEENRDKFIELASKEFSYFTYELTEDVIGDASYTATLNLADSIGILMYVNDPTGTLSKYNVKATYKGVSTDYSLENADDVPAENQTHRYRILIADCAAAEMFENVHVVVTYDGINIKEFDYSVYDYCSHKISSSESETLKELCMATLDFGCYAKYYFSYVETVPVSGTYTARSVSDVEVQGASASSSNKFDILKSVSATLSLESRTKIVFYLTPKTIEGSDKVYDLSLTNFRYAVTDNSLTEVDYVYTKESSGRIRIEVTGIAAPELGNVYTLTVTPTESGDAMTVSYSPMSYAVSKKDSKTYGLSDLSKSLYKYYSDAADHFKQN